jgi:hypothetical protein
MVSAFLILFFQQQSWYNAFAYNAAAAGVYERFRKNPMTI